MKEREGVLIYNLPPTGGPPFVSAFFYAAGTYNDIGVLPGVSMSQSPWSMAFSDTDLLIGDSVDHHDPTQMCMRYGSILVFRPLLGLRTALRMMSITP